MSRSSNSRESAGVGTFVKCAGIACFVLFPLADTDAAARLERSPYSRVGYAGSEESDISMDECKHGMKSGCAYCHAPKPAPTTRAAAPKRGNRTSRLSEKMNDRMTALNKRLREIRGS